ncbi:hypothetical protein DDD_2554 [Nonlabens dokdonensis DSW-6]|uniref:Uncharacterized protein n=2 Tax=Nonlabens dokdonensis TaxID=328515 RepID=L7WCL3_NONDD|nr:hypothetical protein DDD_2554 [Nonlabens dokdonensis DSW-6]
MDEENNGQNGDDNDNQDMISVMDRTDEIWNVVNNDQIQPVATTHQSNVSNAGFYLNKQYHISNIFTGFQASSEFCEYNEGQWSNCTPAQNYIYNINETGVLGFYCEDANANHGTPAEIFTREYNSNTMQFDDYTQTGIGVNFLDAKILNVNSVYHAIVMKWESNRPFVVYEWNSTSKTWTLENEFELPLMLGAKFDAVAGNDGNIIFSGQEFNTWNRVAYSYDGTNISEFYRENNYRVNSLKAIWKILPMQQDYYLISSNGLKSINTNEVIINGSILEANIHSEMLIVLNGFIGNLDTQSVNGVSVYDPQQNSITNFGTENNGSDLDSRFSGPQNPVNWFFYIKNNTLNMIANVNQGVGGATGNISTDSYHYTINY